MNTDHEAREPWRPELLAGYADGELNVADRATVDAWLLAHPEDRAELDAQKLFAHKNTAFWQKTAAPQPNEAQWNGIFGKICNAANPTRPAYREPVAPWRRWAVGITAIAAAALVALNLNWGPRPVIEGTPVLAPEEALAVASPDDVDIISIQGHDGSIIVFGQQLLNGPLEMIPMEDVVLEAVFSDADGQRIKLDINPLDPKKRIIIDPNHKIQPVP